MAHSLSIIIPALNEEKNLEATVATVTNVVSRYFDDWEIIIFNDGSTDRTGVIALQLAAEHSNIQTFHHITPRNLGACYREGVEIASKELVIMIPGDNECGEAVMTGVFPLAGQADIIIPFTSNPEVRPLMRRLLSSWYVRAMNLISGFRLRYYNGTVLHRTAIVQKAKLQTDSFGYQAECLTQLLRAGHTFLEVGTPIQYRKEGRSKALRLRNLSGVLEVMGRVAVDRFAASFRRRPGKSTA